MRLLPHRVHKQKRILILHCLQQAQCLNKSTNYVLKLLLRLPTKPAYQVCREGQVRNQAFHPLHQIQVRLSSVVTPHFEQHLCIAALDW